MADTDGASERRDFHADVPQRTEGFFLKGSAQYDWGMRNRLARIFDPASGRTVMLAFDHGYFQGPTTGLERIDLSIVPLIPWADTLMLTRGALRTMIPAAARSAIVLRASGGPSVLKELSNEEIALDIEDAIRLNAAALAVQVFVGGEHETKSIHNLTRLVDAGNRYGIPILAVTAVGKEMVRDAKYFRLATRICAELGAHYVKTYYVEDGFETVTSCCPVPIVIAGGKKQPELDALTMARNAIECGASGVDMVVYDDVQIEPSDASFQEAAKFAAEAAKGFTLGDPLSESTRLGPLSSRMQLDRVRSYIKKGVEEGAELVAGGADAPEGLPGGYFVKPTVFGKVKNSMTIAQEEIFGPVLAIIPYRDEEDAVKIANDSPYGLAGAVWSKDDARAQKVARRIRAGQIDVNGGAFNMNAPFGGFKQSGHGREAGVYGLEEFLELKSLQLKG